MESLQEGWFCTTTSLRTLRTSESFSVRPSVDDTIIERELRRESTNVAIGMGEEAEPARSVLIIYSPISHFIGSERV